MQTFFIKQYFTSDMFSLHHLKLKVDLVICIPSHSVFANIIYSHPPISELWLYYFKRYLCFVMYTAIWSLIKLKQPLTVRKKTSSDDWFSHKVAISTCVTGNRTTIYQMNLKLHCRDLKQILGTIIREKKGRTVFALTLNRHLFFLTVDFTSCWTFEKMQV